MTTLDKTPNFAVEPRTYSGLLSRMDDMVEVYRIGLKGKADFIGLTERRDPPTDTFVVQDKANAHWGTLLSAIGEFQKDASGFEDKRSLMEYRYLPPKTSLGAERTRHLLRGIARLYAFLAPTREMLALCERLTQAPADERFRTTLVVGNMLFAAKSIDSDRLEDLVRVPLKHVFPLRGDGEAICEYGRYGVINGRCLKALLLHKNVAQNFLEAWQSLRPDTLPVAAWLDTQAVSIDSLPRSRSLQGRKSKEETDERKAVITHNVTLAQRAIWRERIANRAAYLENVGEVMRQFNARLGSMNGVQMPLRHLNVTLDVAERVAQSTPVDAFFYGPSSETLLWAHDAVLPIVYRVTENDALRADSLGVHRSLFVNGLGPRAAVAFAGAADGETFERPLIDLLDFGIALGKDLVLEAATPIEWNTTLPK